MADPYIDPFETQLYGKFAREQMAEVCRGKVREFDKMVHFAIAAQQGADNVMAEALARQPGADDGVHSAEVIAEAGDVLVRFGYFLESLKGRPVDPRDFFGSDPPSVLARRRLNKLGAGVGKVLEETRRHAAKIRDVDHWIGELEEVHGKLQTLERQRQASKLSRAEISPEVEAARQKWLEIYNANKHLIRGLLDDVGKPELLPLIFDDLADVHQVIGVSDELPEGITVDAQDREESTEPTKV